MVKILLNLLSARRGSLRVRGPGTQEPRGIRGDDPRHLSSGLRLFNERRGGGKLGEKVGSDAALNCRQERSIFPKFDHLKAHSIHIRYVKFNISRNHKVFTYSATL